MLVSSYARGNATIVAATGRIDSTTSVDLEKRLLSLLRRGEKALVLDLAAVDYMASVGLRVLLAVAKQSKVTKSVLVLARPNDFVRDILKMTGFIDLFEVFDDLDAAVTAARR